jgi:hypothetical protein
MPHTSEDLRREAARCLEAAQKSKDLNSRAELIRLADKFLELANLDEYNGQHMGSIRSSRR